ncbi:unnamed protein product, partial [Amoebophrya sp. A25]
LRRFFAFVGEVGGVFFVFFLLGVEGRFAVLLLFLEELPALFLARFADRGGTPTGQLCGRSRV